MSKTLFCVHISGMDDVVPVRNIDEAVHAAAELNEAYLAAHKELAKGRNPELLPFCFAAPAIWPHDEKSHASSLGELLERAKDKGCPYWMYD